MAQCIRCLSWPVRGAGTVIHAAEAAHKLIGPVSHQKYVGGRATGQEGTHGQSFVKISTVLTVFGTVTLRRRFTFGRRVRATRQASRIVTENVVAPVTDSRKYRVLNLENGMQVLLASDPCADMAGAAISVKCGSFQDTDQRPGLAHFHEHMLFLGTKKYPEEDEYNKFLAEHGGDSNAYTASEYTAYYFKVAASHLDGALDRLAQFFISPTFASNCVEREMQAVDSESTKYSSQDNWRLSLVLKSTADPGHPFHRFDVGNLQTLGADEAMQTREELLLWNQEHYQAGAMRLAVVGNESLDKLQATVEKLFTNVPEGPGKVIKYDCLPWGKKQLGRIISCVPLKETRSIALHWPMPPQSEHLFSKPLRYLSHILGHEGHGSLHHVLNQRGLIDTLSAGGGHSFSDTQLFSISISLTREGDACRDQVLGLVFQYIAMIQNTEPQQTIFQEIASLQQIAFAHQEDSPNPDVIATSAAASLHKYPPREVLRGPYVVNDWQPEIVQEHLALMQPENCLVFLTSSAFSEEAEQAIQGSLGDSLGWKREQWYDALFKEEVLSMDRINAWKLAASKADIGDMGLPQLNPFIPHDFSLRSQHVKVDERTCSRLPAEITPPAPLIAKPALRVWYKLDSAFCTPRENVIAQVYTPAYEAGPNAVIMLRLFVSLVEDDLNAYSYDASVAGLGYRLDFSDNLVLFVSGFNDRLPKLLDVVVKRIGGMLVETEGAQTEDGATTPRACELLAKLNTQRNLLLQSYRNFTKQEPYSISRYYVSQILQPGSWNISEYIAVLEQPTSLVHMASAVRDAFHNIQVEALVHGNASKDEACAVAQCLEHAFFTELGAKHLETLRQPQATKLPASTTTVFEYNVGAENPAQENSCTQNVYQIGPVGIDLERDACLNIICRIASASAFEKLRTQEQLGYIVFAGGSVHRNVSSFHVIVQGDKLSPSDVDCRIEAWLADFARELEDMSKDVFRNYVEAVVSDRSRRYGRLSQETSQFWAEIQPRQYQFERTARVVKITAGVTQEAVLKFFHEYLAEVAPSRRKLSMRILGASAKPSCEATLRTLDDIRTLHKEESTFPAQPFADMPEIPNPP